jgi:hypothetical protein
MPSSDISLIVEPELSEKKLLKQLGELNGRISKKTTQYLTQQTTSLLYGMIQKGIVTTGIEGRVHLLRKYGISGRDLNPKVWDILSTAATQAQGHKTLLEKQQRQAKIEENRLNKQKQRDELNKKKEEKKAEDARIKEENKLQEEQRKSSIWSANYKSLTPYERIKGKLGSTWDYKNIRAELENELLLMQTNGATQSQYDAWKRKVETVYGLGERQSKYNTEIERQAKKTGDKSLLSETTYKKFQSKELKGIEKLNKTAKENNVKISGTSVGSGILSRILGALSVQRVASFILGAGESGKRQAMSELGNEIVYGGSYINTLTRFLTHQKISEGTSRQFLGSIADFKQAEKWGRISGEQYNALSLLSSASGSDFLSMMRAGDSIGVMQALRRIRKSGSLSADEMRNYLRMAGWSEEMMVANAPEIFTGAEIARGIQSEGGITTVNRSNAIQNRRSEYLKELNYNRLASGVNSEFTGFRPWDIIDQLTSNGGPGYSKNTVVNIGNVNVDASNKENGKQIGQDFIDAVSDKTVWQQKADQETGGAK